MEKQRQEQQDKQINQQGLFEQSEAKSFVDRYKSMIVGLLICMNVLSCDSSQTDCARSSVADNFVESFSEYEQLKNSNVEKLLDALCSMSATIYENKELQEYIGPDWRDFADYKSLVPVVIAETRANGKANGSAGERSYFQIMKSTHKGVLRGFEKEHGTGIALQEMKDPAIAGAVVYLKSCNEVRKLMEKGLLSRRMSHQEQLQCAYIMHNRGNAGFLSLFKNLGIDSWKEFEKHVENEIIRAGFSFRRWKKEMRQFNDKPGNGSNRKKITYLGFLQHVRRTTTDKELQKLLNSYNAAYIVGISYEKL